MFCGGAAAAAGAGPVEMAAPPVGAGPKNELVAAGCVVEAPNRDVVAAGREAAEVVFPNRPPVGAVVVVVVVVENDKGEGAGAVVLGANRPVAGGAALEVAPRPVKGEAWVFCDVEPSKMDLRFPWASVVGFILRPLNRLDDPVAPWPEGGWPKNDIFAVFGIRQ